MKEEGWGRWKVDNAQGSKGTFLVGTHKHIRQEGQVLIIFLLIIEVATMSLPRAYQLLRGSSLLCNMFTYGDLIYIHIVGPIVPPPVDYVSNPDPITRNWPVRGMECRSDSRIYRIDFILGFDCQRSFVAEYWVNGLYFSAHYFDCLCMDRIAPYDKGHQTT